MKKNILLYVVIPILVLSMVFLSDRIQNDSNFSIIPKFQEASGSHEKQIPSFTNAKIYTSSSTNIKDSCLTSDPDIFCDCPAGKKLSFSTSKNKLVCIDPTTNEESVYVRHVDIIPTEIPSEYLLNVNSLHVDSILLEIQQIELFYDLNDNSNYKLKETVTEIKNDILQRNDYAVFKKLSKLSNDLQKLSERIPAHQESSDKKLISNMIDKINSINNLITDKNKSIKGKIFFENPKKQHKSNIPLDQILCKHPLQIIFKENTGEPACVKKSSIPKLIDRGWGIKFIISD